MATLLEGAAWIPSLCPPANCGFRGSSCKVSQNFPQRSRCFWPGHFEPSEKSRALVGRGCVLVGAFWAFLNNNKGVYFFPEPCVRAGRQGLCAAAAGPGLARCQPGRSGPGSSGNRHRSQPQPVIKPRGEGEPWKEDFRPSDSAQAGVTHGGSTCQQSPGKRFSSALLTPGRARRGKSSSPGLSAAWQAVGAHTESSSADSSPEEGVWGRAAGTKGVFHWLTPHRRIPGMLLWAATNAQGRAGLPTISSP